METLILSSLEKVMLDAKTPGGKEIKYASALRGEKYSFQLALNIGREDYACKVTAVDTAGLEIRTFYVGHVPSELPAFRQYDDDYITTMPGLFPDVLYPHDDFVRVAWDRWHSFWFEVCVDGDAASGEHVIEITTEIFHAHTREKLDEKKDTFTLKIIPATLPEQEIIYTNWFHVDCIASLHECEVFSEQHWDLIEQYMKNAHEYGMTMIYVPLFTPPLDTDRGIERPTVQLVDVETDEQKSFYRFGFERLVRYMKLAESIGYEHFEMSHLFTQWGSENAPKVVASIKGKNERIFGWETDAHAGIYTDFLCECIAELKKVLSVHGWLENTRFHISDEPNEKSIDNYRKAHKALAGVLEGCRTMDALSEPEFYDEGLVDIPVPCTVFKDRFADKVLPEKWMYYCCSECVDVSNRFFAMPSVRTRILGWQMYKYEMDGFLQWAYNFWYSERSRRVINPYANTDADHAFPSGDAFIVYPGENGPVSSLRQLVFNDGFQDHRAMRLLRSLRKKAGKEDEENSVLKALTISSCPTAEELLAQRECINREIEGLM